MTKISIAIPCYEYKGKGVECLEFSFRKLEEQTFKDFDIIISDHSIDNEIEVFCNSKKNILDIKYYRNEEKRGNPAANLNNAIRKADGKWVKILCQDDYIPFPTSLDTLSDNLDDAYNWLATGYFHTEDRENYFNYHFPSLNNFLCINNTIGTPSCVTIKNMKDGFEFDENLFYCYDCDFYYRFMTKYGNPKLVFDFLVINYLWRNSISSQITQETISRENNYILRKLNL